MRITLLFKRTSLAISLVNVRPQHSPYSTLIALSKGIHSTHNPTPLVILRAIVAYPLHIMPLFPFCLSSIGFLSLLSFALTSITYDTFSSLTSLLSATETEKSSKSVEETRASTTRKSKSKRNYQYIK